MSNIITVEKSSALRGEVVLSGAKNSVLVLMVSSILVDGTTVLENVPLSSDFFSMKELLEQLGAKITFNTNAKTVAIDCSNITNHELGSVVAKKMRASVLALGPLLSRIRKASFTAPGGCDLGSRPIDFHLKSFAKMGVVVSEEAAIAPVLNKRESYKIVLDYPSVGTTENIILYAAKSNFDVTIVNAALEPEVLDLISMLRKMGADINVNGVASLRVNGVNKLSATTHSVLSDRMEAGAILFATAITGGEVFISNARECDLEIVLEKLLDMGHMVNVEKSGVGVHLKAIKNPVAVNVKTHPFPGFPTDLQQPMMTLQTVAHGTSVIEETVFDGRMQHVKELQKMGAQIVLLNSKATVTGVQNLKGTDVIASDIRASCALVLAGLVAEGSTRIDGLNFWHRAYDRLELKLQALGAKIYVDSANVAQSSVNSLVMSA